MRKSQLSFFHELKKWFFHLVLQMKQCFGRINFDVFTKGLASSRKMIRRRWSFLVTKRLLKDEKGLVCFFVTMSLFFWKTFPSHLQLILSTKHTEKKHCIHNFMLLWKTDVKMTVKEDKIIYSKVKSYFRRLFGPFMGKQRNFESFIIFSCLVKWNWSKHFPFDRH